MIRVMFDMIDILVRPLILLVTYGIIVHQLVPREDFHPFGLLRTLVVIGITLSLTALTYLIKDRIDDSRANRH